MKLMEIIKHYEHVWYIGVFIQTQRGWQVKRFLEEVKSSPPVCRIHVSNIPVLQLKVGLNPLGCHQQEPAPTTAEVPQDSDDIVSLEVEHGVPREDEVEAVLDVFSDNVALFKLPGFIPELLSVLSNVV